MDKIIEAHVLFVLLALSGLMLVAMFAGLSPISDWRIGLVVAGCAVSSAIIGRWVYQDFKE